MCRFLLWTDARRSPDVSPDSLVMLTHYVRREMHALHHTPSILLFDGRLEFGSIDPDELRRSVETEPAERDQSPTAAEK